MNFYIVPKVRLLCISFFFAFISIILSQVLLAYEKDNIILSHCRKLNLEQIFSYNKLSDLPQSNQIMILDTMKLHQTCISYLPSEVQKDVLSINSTNYHYESVGHNIRIYADAFNSLESQRSHMQSRLLIYLMSFNVASLFVMAIFLHADSCEIEQE